MLPCQVVVLFLELSEQELLLQLLLLLERQELLLQLLLPQRGIHGARQSPPQLRGAGAASSPTPHGAGHGSGQHRLHLHCKDKRQASGSLRPAPLRPGSHAGGPEASRQDQQTQENSSGGGSQVPLLHRTLCCLT